MKNETDMLILFLMLLLIPTSLVLAYTKYTEKDTIERYSCSKEDCHSGKKSYCDNENSDDVGCSSGYYNTSGHCPITVNISAWCNEFVLSNSNKFTLIVNDWAYVQHIKS